MKTKLLAICLLLFTSQVFAADVFVCSYKNYKNETRTYTYIRKDDGKFVTFLDDVEIPMVKTYEDNTYLHLVVSFENYLFARVINKITKKVEQVGIEESKTSTVDKVYGTCKVR